MYKTHLLSFDAMIAFLSSASLLGGLLLGGKILAWASGHYEPLFLIDVGTNLVFIAFVFFGCHPDRAASKVRAVDLVRDPDPPPPLAARADAARRNIVVEALKEVVTSFREAGRFLAQRDQRPLLTLLLGSLLFEWIYECYDGGMIVKQVLHGTDEQFRHIEIGWTCATNVVMALLPILARSVSSIAKIFVLAMVLDGVVIALTGLATGFGAVALVPVALLLGTDRSLTNAASTLVGVAQNSASSPAIRGRIAALYAFVAILGDIGAEYAAGEMSDRYAIGGMMFFIGLGQVAIIGVLTLIGGRRFWSYGLRVERFGRRL
jgi:hypothetical protein